MEIDLFPYISIFLNNNDGNKMDMKLKTIF